MTGSTNGRRLSPRRSRRSLRGSRTLTALILALAGLMCTGAVNASAGTVTLPGGPLVVSVGNLGQCQSSYPNVGTNYYPPFGTEGDCGFFLAFPPEGTGQPTILKEKVFGFSGAAGPHLPPGEIYTEGTQGAPTGTGTVADPYTEVTTFKVQAESLDYAEITDTTKYVNGTPEFTSTYKVENVTGKGGSTAPSATLFYHAIMAGDLFVANDDHGTGVFLGGPPRFIGGQNPNTGTLGGFIEATPAWDNWQEGEWDSVIWEAVRKSPVGTPVFNDSIDPTLLDNGAGASWDDRLKTGLKPGESTSYTIVNRSQVPTALSVQPVSQSHTVGQTATVNVTAVDTANVPYANRPLVYSIGGANPKTGSVTTNAAGQAVISYVGTAAGLDTMQLFLDLNGNGSADTGEPSAASQIVWAPAPPTPNSSYTIQSIKANPDGTITIVFVPTQDGTATVEVTVPTATISRNASIAKKKKCKKNQVRIKGKCRPKTTVSGKVTAAGKAGVPLKVTVKPSSKVKKALAKGKSVQLTAKLTYKSTLGGTPTVKTYHFTVKPKKKKKHH